MVAVVEALNEKGVGNLEVSSVGAVVALPLTFLFLLGLVFPVPVLAVEFLLYKVMVQCLP